MTTSAARKLASMLMMVHRDHQLSFDREALEQAEALLKEAKKADPQGNHEYDPKNFYTKTLEQVCMEVALHYNEPDLAEPLTLLATRAYNESQDWVLKVLT